MNRFILIFLISTGFAAAIAITFPQLVILGFFLGFFPGLLLALAPTAFLYGLVFAAFWWGIRRRASPSQSFFIAIGGTILFFATIAYLLNQPVRHIAHAEMPENIVPASAISVRGNVQLNISANYAKHAPSATAVGPDQRLTGRQLGCDRLCLALLFDPNIEAVIVNQTTGDDRTLSNLATEYRVLEGELCDEMARTPVVESSLGGIWPDDFSTVHQSRVASLFLDRCLESRAPMTTPDFHITIKRTVVANLEPVKRWSFRLENPAFIQLRVEDSDGDQILRSTMVEGQKFIIPFTIGTGGPTGGGSLELRFGWGRVNFADNRFDIVRTLDQQTTIDFSAGFQGSRRENRALLRTALLEETLSGGSPAFGVAPLVFEDIERGNLEPGDIDLLLAYIAHDKTREFRNLADAIAEIGRQDQGRFRVVLATRIARNECGESEHMHRLGAMFRAVSPGTFAELTPLERSLIDDDTRLECISGLVQRLSDMGSNATPLLVDIMRRSLENGHIGVADAARYALSVLGRDASDALGPINEMVRSGLIGEHWIQHREWALTLARLGQPIASIEKPENLSGTEARYHERLRRRLEDFRPSRTYS